jgi:hypothetical protein
MQMLRRFDPRALRVARIALRRVWVRRRAAGRSQGDLSYALIPHFSQSAHTELGFSLLRLLVFGGGFK